LMQYSYSHDIVPDESLPYLYTPLKCYFSTTSPRMSRQYRSRTLAAYYLSILWRYPQTPLLSAALENAHVVWIGGVRYQETILKSYASPPARSRSGALGEVCHVPKNFTWLAFTYSASGRANRSAAARTGTSKQLPRHTT